MSLVFLTSVAVTVWETVSAFVPQLLLIQEAVAELVSVSTGEHLPFAVSIALKMHSEKQCSVCSGRWEIKKSRILTLLCMCHLTSSCSQELKNNPCLVSETWRVFILLFQLCSVITTIHLTNMSGSINPVESLV